MRVHKERSHENNVSQQRENDNNAGKSRTFQPPRESGGIRMPVLNPKMANGEMSKSKPGYAMPPPRQLRRNADQKNTKAATSNGNKKMPEEVQAKMEATLGHDLSAVNIHENSKKSEEIGAHAYAQGNDVHFAPGAYNPESKKGQELLGHELTHVVQQRKGIVKPTTQTQDGMPVNDDKGLEKEADDMGRIAANAENADAAQLKAASANPGLTGPIQKKNAETEEEGQQDQDVEVEGELFQDENGQLFIEVDGEMVPQSEEEIVEQEIEGEQTNEEEVEGMEQEGGPVPMIGEQEMAPQEQEQTQLKPENGVAQGFFKKIGRAIGRAARSVGRGVRNVARGIGRGVRNAARGIGRFGRRIGRGVRNVARGIGRGLRRLGRGIGRVAGRVWNGVKWVARQTWDKFTGIFHRVGRFFSQLPKRVVGLIQHLWTAVKNIKPWSLEWWKSLGRADTWRAVLNWVIDLGVRGLELIGVGEIYETLADIIKFNTRKLTGEEIAEARKVFGDNLNYNLIRIDEGSFVVAMNGRAYVSFHTINSWGSLDYPTLIHELTHVWQYEQRGAIYMADAIRGQNSSSGYDYGGVATLQANQATGMSAFNPEQQGDIIQDYYDIISGRQPSSGFARLGGMNLTAARAIYQTYADEVRR